MVITTHLLLKEKTEVTLTEILVIPDTLNLLQNLLATGLLVTSLVMVGRSLYLPSGILVTMEMVITIHSSG